MSEKVNLSLFENFFESSSSAYYEKMLININPDENKEIVAEIRDRISNFKKRIKKMSGKEKKDKNAGETLEIIKNFFDYNKIASKNFKHASKVDKRNSEPKTEESIVETVKFKNEKIAEIKKEEKNTMNCLCTTSLIIKNQVIYVKIT